MRETGMSILEVKQLLETLKGKPIELSVNRGRNKVDTFLATIEILYPSVFTISSSNSKSKTETFSYSDILCSKVKLPASNN
ncbi:MAG: Veg family protein [Clostridia bacterium]